MAVEPFTERDIQALRRNGLVLPSEPIRARLSARRMADRVGGGSLSEDVANILGPSRSGARVRQRLDSYTGGLRLQSMTEGDPQAREMHLRRSGSLSAPSSSQLVWPKYRDPFDYWKDKAEWFDPKADGEQTKKLRDWCFETGSQVSTVAGFRSIEEIEKGDWVLTHRGRYRQVLATSVRPYHGELCEITPLYGPTLGVTPGHEIYVRRGGTESWVESQDIGVGDKVLIPVDRSEWDTPSVSMWDVLDPTQWDVDGCGTIWKRAGGYAACRSRIREALPLDDDLLWLIGNYLADGSVAARKVVWSHNARDRERAEEALERAQRVFGCGTLQDRTAIDGTVNLKVSAAPLEEWFGQFGRSSHTKGLPDLYMQLPPERTKALLRGYFEGDGFLDDQGIRCSTTSSRLAYQVATLMRRAGYRAYVRRYTGKAGTFTDRAGRIKTAERRDGWMIGLYGQQGRAFAAWMGGEPKTTEATLEEASAGFWVPVRRIGRTQYEGAVHNLEVEEDNSYVVSVAAHNCRLMYQTHHLVPSLIDIYSRFPILDIEFRHQDARLAQWYEDLFMNELDYQEFLYDIGREFWTVGEAFALGSWHDGIGAWEADDAINPDDVVVTANPLLRTQQFHIKVPDEIKDLIASREPADEYRALVEMYPDMVAFARKDEDIPISDVLMKQAKFKATPWAPRGTPILLRAFKQLMLEQSLQAAQDAVADRFYSPLILAKLGLDDPDGQGPWVPDPAELDAIRNDINLALASDFRLMVYHHGLDIQSVFGRESMPRLDGDFDRVDQNLMGVFGIGPDLLRGGNGNAPYASGALNRELVTQLLQTYQLGIKRLMRERMEPVAERQGHYDYRTVGNRRVPVMETVLVQDEETGEEYVEERPKLAIPEVHLKAMNLRDEKLEREFLGNLKDRGFPISMGTLAVNIPIDFHEELEASREEKLDSVVAEQEFKLELFERLDAKKLPIPVEYKQEYDAWKAGVQSTAPPPGPIPGIESPVPAPNLAPSQEQAEQYGYDVDTSGDAPPDTPTDDSGSPQPRTRPPESDEMRGEMPKRAASILDRDVHEEILANLPDHLQERAASVREASRSSEDRPVVYGPKMRLGTPLEMRWRRKMRVPTGTRIATPEEASLKDGGYLTRIANDMIEDLRSTVETWNREHPELNSAIDDAEQDAVERGHEADSYEWWLEVAAQVRAEADARGIEL